MSLHFILYHFQRWDKYFPHCACVTLHHLTSIPFHFISAFICFGGFSSHWYPFCAAFHTLSHLSTPKRKVGIIFAVFALLRSLTLSKSSTQWTEKPKQCCKPGKCSETPGSVCFPTASFNSWKLQDFTTVLSSTIMLQIERQKQTIRGNFVHQRKETAVTKQCPDKKGQIISRKGCEKCWWWKWESTAEQTLASWRMPQGREVSTQELAHLCSAGFCPGCEKNSSCQNSKTGPRRHLSWCVFPGTSRRPHALLLYLPQQFCKGTRAL